MKLYTVEHDHKELVAIQGSDNHLYSLSSFGFEVKNMNELILNLETLAPHITAKFAAESVAPINNYKILAPITTPLQDVVCLGVNYHNHIAETADVIDFTKQADTVYFSKRVNRCNNPDGTIPHYDFVDKLDYEVELGIILKKDAFQVSVEDAADYILGYTIINDVSARDIQLKHQQWYLGKSLDGYTPMGLAS